MSQSESSPSPEEARALVEQAARSGSVTKSGASWPQIAGLLTLGATSSLALPAMAIAPINLLPLVIVLMMVWILASFLFMTTFSRSVKRGFGKRWILTITIWAAVWILGIFGASIWFVGEVWFLAVACGLLTAITMIGAWIEARK